MNGGNSTRFAMAAPLLLRSDVTAADLRQRARGPATRIRRGGGWRWRRSTTAARAATRRGSAGWGCRSCATGGEIQRGRPRRPDRPQGVGSVAAIEHPSGRPWRRWSRAGRFPPCMAWCAGGWPIWPSGSGPVGLGRIPQRGQRADGQPRPARAWVIASSPPGRAITPSPKARSRILKIIPSRSGGDRSRQRRRSGRDRGVGRR